MIFVLVGVFLGILIFSFFVPKNPFKLYMVFGKKGSGKSTFLAKMAIKYQKRGYTVYSTMDDFSYPMVRKIDVADLGDFVPESNSCLIVDEVGMIWDNRNFKNFKSSVRDFFKLQRHYKVVCFLASQTFDIDKKLRDLTDAMYLCCHFLGYFTVAKKIVRKVVLVDSTAEGESRIADNLSFTFPTSWVFTFIPKYSKFFDSFVVPDLPKLPYTEVPALPSKSRKTAKSLKLK